MRHIADFDVLCTHFARVKTDTPGNRSGRSAMGPFPHDANPATITAENPMGTDGFEFVEFAHPEPAQLHELFLRMGFVAVAKHRTRASTLYRQGSINYLVTEQPGSHA